MKLVLHQIPLKGVNKIKDTIIAQSRNVVFDENGNDKVVKEHMVVTSGINIEMLKNFKGIDNTRTSCNDIVTIYKLYGIEAARNCLFYEFQTTFGSGGSGVNYNHLSLLVDFMTHTGDVTSIDRHGLGKLDIDTMAKASFEKQMEHFVNAAVFNETDNLNSVSSRIMVGQVFNGGTGAFSLILDTDKLVNSEYVSDELGGRSEFKNIEPDMFMEDIIKFGLNETKFFIPT